MKRPRLAAAVLLVAVSAAALLSGSAQSDSARATLETDDVGLTVPDSFVVDTDLGVATGTEEPQDQSAEESLGNVSGSVPAACESPDDVTWGCFTDVTSNYVE